MQQIASHVKMYQQIVAQCMVGYPLPIGCCIFPRSSTKILELKKKSDERHAEELRDLSIFSRRLYWPALSHKSYQIKYQIYFSCYRGFQAVFGVLVFFFVESREGVDPTLTLTPTVTLTPTLTPTVTLKP